MYKTAIIICTVIFVALIVAIIIIVIMNNKSNHHSTPHSAPHSAPHHDNTPISCSDAIYKKFLTPPFDKYYNLTGGNDRSTLKYQCGTNPDRDNCKKLIKDGCINDGTVKSKYCYARSLDSYNPKTKQYECICGNWGKYPDFKPQDHLELLDAGSHTDKLPPFNAKNDPSSRCKEFCKGCKKTDYPLCNSAGLAQWEYQSTGPDALKTYCSIPLLQEGEDSSIFPQYRTKKMVWAMWNFFDNKKCLPETVTEEQYNQAPKKYKEQNYWDYFTSKQIRNIGWADKDGKPITRLGICDQNSIIQGDPYNNDPGLRCIGERNKGAFNDACRDTDPPDKECVNTSLTFPGFKNVKKDKIPKDPDGFVPLGVFDI